VPQANVPAVVEEKQAEVDPAKEMTFTLEALKTLEKLGPQGRRRAVSYLADIFGVADAIALDRPAIASRGGSVNPNRSARQGGGNDQYASFAELLNAAGPDTGVMRALCGGYWMQVCQGSEEFASADVNKELANAVGPLSNITMAFDALKAMNPALVIQTKKSGKAKQARKLYRLTAAGIRAVDDMIAQRSGNGS